MLQRHDKENLRKTLSENLKINGEDDLNFVSFLFRFIDPPLPMYNKKLYCNDYGILERRHDLQSIIAQY
jgi:hypothetical protein